MDKILKTFIFSLMLVLLGCNTAKESVEVEDQGRFNQPPVAVTPPPTNADISYINSVVYMTAEQIFETQTSTLSFTARDSDGVAIEEGGLAVSFSLVGDGTSSGTFSAVNDLGNGVYTVTLTATGYGSPNTVLVQVGGTPIVQLNPFQLHVLSGEYFRELSFSNPTNQDEYQIKLTLNSSNIDYSNIDSNGDDLRFFDSNYVPQDYWIEKWDTSGDSIVWVKVQSSGTTSIIMSYGNAALTSDSNKEEVFSYDVAKEVYYELSQAASNRNHSISSYTNLNSVTVKTTGPDVVNVISPVLPVTTPNTVQGPISVLGPISGRFQTSSRGSDSIMPIAFASRTLGYPKSRGQDDWDLYNPNTTNANVTLYNYNNSGGLLNSFNYTVNAGSTLHIDYDVSKFGLIESDLPLVGLYYYSDQSDGAQLLPPSTDIVGVLATGASLGITQNATTGTIYYSDGTSQGFSGNTGATIDMSGGGSQNAAIGARIISNKPVVANGQADSDGSDSETYWPLEELDDDYIIPSDSQYITVVCPETVNLTVTDPGPNSTAGVCTPAGPYNPGVRSFGSATVVTFSAGTRITGDANFYVYYEYSDQDETNVTSWKQARSYSEVDVAVTIGVEQTYP
jgi:hypothetical protein